MGPEDATIASGATSDATWRGLGAVVLENDVVRVVAVPSLGARIVSLLDVRTGREWLVQGAPPGPADWAAEGAVFGGREAFGWDECLPTVAPCPDPTDPAAPPLRDHGDQWGRPAEVIAHGGGWRAIWASPRWPFVLHRTVRLDGPVVVASYELEARAGRPLPFLWSMHTLLALEPGSRLLIEPPGPARLTHHTGLGIGPATGDEIVWPDAGTAGGSRLRLDEIRDLDAGQATKLYLEAGPLATVAARAPDGAELRFGWDRGFAPALGVWLDFGGWPPGDARHQVALEPTTSPDDDLASALDAGRASVVEPGQPARWTVRLDVVPAHVDQADGGRVSPNA